MASPVASYFSSTLGVWPRDAAIVGLGLQGPKGRSFQALGVSPGSGRDGGRAAKQRHTVASVSQRRSGVAHLRARRESGRDTGLTAVAWDKRRFAARGSRERKCSDCSARRDVAAAHGDDVAGVSSRRSRRGVGPGRTRRCRGRAG